MEPISMLQIWPWLGASIAWVLLFLLFGTNVLKGCPDQKRWRDAQWVGWLAVAVILLHVTEEYGCSVTGEAYGFPSKMQAILSGAVGHSVALPEAMFPVVNMTVGYLAIPTVAILAKRRPFVLTSTMGLFGINAITHIGPGIALGEVNPGMLTGIVLFLPMAIWYFYAFFATGSMKVRWGWFIIVNGAITMGILGAGILSYANGVIGTLTLMVIHCVNAALIVLVPLLEEKLIGQKRLYRDR